jgi:hypothetical protein
MYSTWNIDAYQIPHEQHIPQEYWILSGQTPPWWWPTKDACTKFAYFAQFYSSQVGHGTNKETPISLRKNSGK